VKTILFAMLLAACGGGGKSDDKPATDDKPGAIKSDDEYMTKAMAFMDKMTATFKADGDNCDKLADDVGKLVDDPSTAAMQLYERAHPALQKQLEAKMADKLKALSEAMAPSAVGCANNKKLEGVMSKL